MCINNWQVQVPIWIANLFKFSVLKSKCLLGKYTTTQIHFSSDTEMVTKLKMPKIKVLNFMYT